MNVDKLKTILPIKVYDELLIVINKYNIDNSLKLAHFLAQAAHESGGFKYLYENLNYSAQGLANTWSNRYAINPKASKKVPNELALKLQRNPEKIANNCYANRNGNGNEASGDGWKFRGRGFIQLTGKDNYKAFTDFIGEDCISNPDLVATKYALSSAAYYFNKRNIWSKCVISDDNNKVVKSITLLVNGGLNGLNERILYFNKFYKVLNS